MRCAEAIARDFAALPSSEIKVVMTLDARLAEEPGPWELERIADGEHERKLRELATAADFTVLVAPETSGVLARLTRDLEGAGVRLLGSSARAVDLTGDKTAPGGASSISGDRHASFDRGRSGRGTAESGSISGRSQAG